MKAVVKTEKGKGNVFLKDFPEPIIRSGHVKIKVDSAGICGTDIKIRTGDTWSNPPVILGHEFSGIVTEIGEGVTSVSLGENVISETAQIVCGDCYYCKTGNYLMCPDRLSIGYGVDGAFAEYIVVREGIIHKIPEGISLKDAALCEPLAVAVHAVFDSVVLQPTDTVVVMGPGTIGLLVAQVAAVFGSRVVVTGVTADADRFEVAKSVGVSVTINNQKEDTASIIHELTDGMGADYVFDCSGALPAIQAVFSFIKRMGTIVQVGLTKPSLEIPYALLPQNEITIKGTFGHNWLSWERALKLLVGGKVNVGALITGEYHINDWEEAFDIAEKQQGIKTLIHPNG